MVFHKRDSSPGLSIEGENRSYLHISAPLALISAPHEIVQRDWEFCSTGNTDDHRVRCFFKSTWSILGLRLPQPIGLFLGSTERSSSGQYKDYLSDFLKIGNKRDMPTWLIFPRYRAISVLDESNLSRGSSIRLSANKKAKGRKGS